ncbi:MAG: hypothetical protein WCL04_03770 [Verrucomicrobiota bacterium]
MKPSDQDRLLRELLGDEHLEQLRDTSLASALASLRARRRRRTALTRATAAVMLLMGLGLLWHGQPARDLGTEAVTPSSRGLTAASVPTATGASRLQPEGDLASAPPEPPATGVQLINDEELFALFPGRSMALIGPPGAQQFVFLDGQ